MAVKGKVQRLGQVARKLNVGMHSIVSFLKEKGYDIEENPNAKINYEQFQSLENEFATSALDKEEASFMHIGSATNENIVISHSDQTRGKQKEEQILIKNNTTQKIFKKADTPTSISKVKQSPATTPEEDPSKAKETKPTVVRTRPEKVQGLKILKKIDIEKSTPRSSTQKEEAQKPTSPTRPVSTSEKEVLRAKNAVLKQPVVVDKIELKESTKISHEKRKPRKRIFSPSASKSSSKTREKPSGRSKEREVSSKEINENIKATLAKLSQSASPTSHARVKYRKEKKSAQQAHSDQEDSTKKILYATEFISVSDLAALMDVSVNALIAKCMELGMLVSINQRIDSEVITILCDEFGFEVQFSSPEAEISVESHEQELEDSEFRAPIVTIMGHVDHGKTSLLDYIRNTKVSAGEAGGITQHIGAYEVYTKEKRKVVFLDTPGHAAFTAMRARGTKLTDVAVIVIAADDSVMPQTEEAINHVKVAGVPFLIALNKIDKPNAQPEKIREQLSKLNVLVEEWGGKIQSQEISAKSGKGIEQLLEKLLLEADILELKANAKKSAQGSVIEAALDKGRGYVTNVLVQNGTLRVGDVVLAGMHMGKVKAMFNHIGEKITEALPSTPVQILGMDGPPQAGDRLQLMKNEKQAREIANKKQQLVRQQTIRTKKHITLDEIGRRLALGSFKELNVLIKADVDGSVEALSDALLKLSTEEVQVNVVHKGVGQISESDILLASTADAIVIGFQVRPSENAKHLADKEQIEIRLYSVIFETINEIKDAIEGMHDPKIEEIVTATLDVKQAFKLPKVGVIAGCGVKKGTLKRTHLLRVIREGIVLHQGEVAQLKHFKEEVEEVKQGQECGISIKDYHDIKESDAIEAFERREIKRSL